MFITPRYRNTVFRYGSMVFRMFEPVVPVNTGTSVTGVGWVEVSPVTDAIRLIRAGSTHE